MTILSPLFEPLPEQEQTLPSSRNPGTFPTKTTNDSALLQWNWICTRRSADLNSAFLFFLFIPSLGGHSCSAHACPEAFTCSRSVNHHRCFVTWSQVETLLNKNVKMSIPVLLCHPGLYCINYTFSSVQQSWSEALWWKSPRGDSSILLWGFGGGHLYLCCRERNLRRFWTGYRKVLDTNIQ